MASVVILVEAQPRAVADGSSVTVRLAGGGAQVPYSYGGEHWRAGVVSLPTIITELDFDGADLGTGGVPQAAEIEWGPASQDDVADLAAYYWGDAPITVRIGPEGPLPPVALAGKVLAASTADGRLKIALADPAADLKKPLLTARFAGTGGLEGPLEWEGRIKRRVWGRVFNQVGEPIDKANNIYAFADPQQQLQEIVTVRDKGATAAALTPLAWAGSAAATLTALQAAAAPAGGGVIAASIACVKWWTQPAGDLHADIKGEIGAGYVETSAEIAARLVAAIGGPAFAAGAVAGAAVLRPAPVGWAAGNDNTTVSAMLDELLGSSSLLWVLDAAGQIAIREWAWGASIASAASHSVRREDSWKPVATRRLGYQRNENAMARGDIAAIVLTSEVQTATGTPIEDVIADVAASIAGPAVVTIAADHTGAVVATLPRTVPYLMLRGTDDVTAAAAWSVAVLTGTIGATIGAADGVLSLNTSSGTLTSATLRISADYAGAVRNFDVKVTKELGSAPASGGGGSGSAGSVTGGIYGSTSSTGMTATGDELNVDTGSAGQVDLTAYYEFDTATIGGTYREVAQWYWWNGSAYVALGTAETSGPYIASSGDPGMGGCGFSATGLTASATHKFRLYMANQAGAVTRNIYGSCAAIGS